MTRLGDSGKLLVTTIFALVAYRFGNFWVYFEKHYLEVNKMWLMLGKFWKNLGFFLLRHLVTLDYLVSLIDESEIG